MSGTNLLCENAQPHDPTTLPSVELFGNNKAGNQPWTVAIQWAKFQQSKEFVCFFVPERRGEVSII